MLVAAKATVPVVMACTIQPMMCSGIHSDSFNSP
jgi:hypothetical protein